MKALLLASLILGVAPAFACGGGTGVGPSAACNGISAEGESSSTYLVKSTKTVDEAPGLLLVEYYLDKNTTAWVFVPADKVYQVWGRWVVDVSAKGNDI